MLQRLYVNSQLVDCEGGSGPQRCLQVRQHPDEDWQLFYGHIEGFSFESGYRYTLWVDVVPLHSPPEDASSLRYVLIEVEDATPDSAA